MYVNTIQLTAQDRELIDDCTVLECKLNVPSDGTTQPFWELRNFRYDKMMKMLNKQRRLGANSADTARNVWNSILSGNKTERGSTMELLAPLLPPSM